MSWDVQRESDSGALSISGELTIFSVGDIREQLCDAFARHDALKIDLSKVTEIDTAGLQLMLLAKRKAGKSVTFCRHSDAVLRLIDLANVAQILGDALILDAD